MYHGKFSRKNSRKSNAEFDYKQSQSENNQNSIPVSPMPQAEALQKERPSQTQIDSSYCDFKQQPDISVQPVLSTSSKRKTAVNPDSVLNLQFNRSSRTLDSDLSTDSEEKIMQISKPVYRRGKGPVIGSIIFYLLLVIGIGLFWLNLQGSLDRITKQLTAYEKMQPHYVSQQVFTEIFGSPDWGAIYDNAHLELSEYEGKTAFEEYMEERVGDASLTYQKVPASGGDRIQYRILLNKKSIASFFLKNHSEDPNAPVWQLDGIDAYFDADQTYRISGMSDYTVKVNGVALDNRSVIQRTGKMLTEDLGNLKAGTELPGTVLYEVSHLLVKPEVTVTTADGQPLEVFYNEETSTFSVPAMEQEIPEEIRNLTLNAVKTYCEYMIKKAYHGDLSKYFKQGTDSFKAITGSDLTWIQKESGHSTADERVTDYIRISKDAFSIRVSLTWQLERQDGTIKKSPVDVSLIFERQNNGKWLCTRMTGLEFVKPFNTVRARFMHEDTVIASVMVDADDKVIQCPSVGIPEGRKMAGWVMVMQDDQGNDYYKRVLEPDASGNAVVLSGIFEKPVDFYPVHVKE